MTSINVTGHAGDIAQFFDSPGNDTFYAYADYNNSGQPLAGMYGTGYSNSASGFGTNVGYSTDGGNDTASVLRLAGQRHVLCLRGLQQQRRAVGGHVRQLRRRLFQRGQRLRHATSAMRPTAAAIRPCSTTRRATTRSMPTRTYNNSGKPLGGHVRGSGYSNAASGFATNVGYSTNGGSDTAVFFDSPGNNTFYAYADYNNSGKPLAGMSGSRRIPTRPAVSPPTSAMRPTAATIRPLLRLAGQRHVLCLRGLQATAAQPLAGMYGGSGYSNSANGFGTNVAYSTNGGSDTAVILRLAGQQHVLCLRGLQQQQPAVGGHVRQRLFQCGQRLRHEHRLCDQRRQRHGRSVRFVRRNGQCPLHGPGDRPALREQLFGARRRGFQVVNAIAQGGRTPRATAP